MPMIPIITDAEHHDQRDGYDLSGIRTLAELIGYLATVAREKGWDEVEVVAAFIKVGTPCREDVREAEQLLRQLGYTAVCDHLRKIAILQLFNLPFESQTSREPRTTVADHEIAHLSHCLAIKFSETAERNCHQDRGVTIGYERAADDPPTVVRSVGIEPLFPPGCGRRPGSDRTSADIAQFRCGSAGRFSVG